MTTNFILLSLESVDSFSHAETRAELSQLGSYTVIEVDPDSESHSTLDVVSVSLGVVQAITGAAALWLTLRQHKPSDNSQAPEGPLLSSRLESRIVEMIMRKVPDASMDEIASILDGLALDSDHIEIELRGYKITGDLSGDRFRISGKPVREDD